MTSSIKIIGDNNHHFQKPWSVTSLKVTNKPRWLARTGCQKCPTDSNTMVLSKVSGICAHPTVCQQVQYHWITLSRHTKTEEGYCSPSTQYTKIHTNKFSNYVRNICHTLKGNAYTILAYSSTCVSLASSVQAVFTSDRQAYLWFSMHSVLP